MKSAEIYKTLNTCLKEPFKALGYKKVKFSRLGWHKSFGSNYIIIQFQCNQWGWNFWTGTDVTLYLGLYPKMTEPTWSLKPVTLLTQLLDEADMKDLVNIQNSVIGKFHKYDENYQTSHPTADPAFLGYLEKQFQPIPFPPSRSNQERMRIYDESDVLKWGDYFQKRLSKMSTSIEELWIEPT
ncbi:MAG: hypothetical protein PHI97_29220 [Desulfobulbus sp.]|nr:hypothetical protein [Desulfobulbus sp.]